MTSTQEFDRKIKNYRVWEKVKFKESDGEAVMAFNEITLSSEKGKNLISLLDTVMFINRTQERLSTGNQMNSTLDNRFNYYTAQTHRSHADDTEVD